MLLNPISARRPGSKRGMKASRSMKSAVRAFRIDYSSSHVPGWSIARLPVAVSIDNICEFVERPYDQFRAALFWFHEVGTQMYSSLIG